MRANRPRPAWSQLPSAEEAPPSRRPAYLPEAVLRGGQWCAPAIEEEPTANGDEVWTTPRQEEEQPLQEPLALTDDAGQKRVVNWDPDSFFTTMISTPTTSNGV